MAETDIYSWSNDEAADWFHLFWKNNDFSLVVETILNFNLDDEEFDSFRAAVHVLCCFGSAYAFPVRYIEQRKVLILKSIEILNNMVNPQSEKWNFLENWDYDERVIKDIKRQIEYLNFILSQ
ncbi:hypothetical protein A4G20_02870 [Pasteurellaceae bacterium RH1A]|nr:hypothetical protein A4G20_02870 [Pasteurellaceae bacterium RH1A]